MPKRAALGNKSEDWTDFFLIVARFLVRLKN